MRFDQVLCGKMSLSMQITILNLGARFSSLQCLGLESLGCREETPEAASRHAWEIELRLIIGDTWFSEASCELSGCYRRKHRRCRFSVGITKFRCLKQ